MNCYSESLIKNLQERVAYFKNAGLGKEAELLQARLKALESKPAQTIAMPLQREFFQNPAANAAREALQAKLAAETSSIPILEKQYILEKLGAAQTLKELEPLRVAYLERILKIHRAAHSENIELGSAKEATGPYNNEKTFCEALRIIYAQDPLWIEDLKELYFSGIKKTLILLFALANTLLFTSCYTRLMNDHGEIAESRSNVSRCENCLAEVPFAGSFQVCVWERNFFGHPEHRCYYTGYSSSWLYFHNTPWWYRSSYSWYDTRGCPAYYYHDRASRSCRYYGKPHVRESAVAEPSRPEPPRPEPPRPEPPRPRPQSRSISSGVTVAPPALSPSLPPLNLNRDEAAEQMLKPTVEQRPAEQRPAEQRPIEQRPIEQRPIEQRPPEQNNRPRPSMRGM